MAELVNVHDTELLRLGAVLKALREKQAKRTDLEAFRKEIIGRCEEAGFVVDVKTWTTPIDETFSFEVELVDRCEPKPFDHERQTWEVRQDVLDLGTGGVIKMDPTGPQQPHSHPHKH
jgi:hypothetical protein